MSNDTLTNLGLKKKIANLGYEIGGDIDHGECFYDKEMLDSFLKTLDNLKETAVAYYESNKEDD